MSEELKTVATGLTEVKASLEPGVDLKQNLDEFKDHWNSDSLDVQVLKASLEQLRTKLGGLTGMLSSGVVTSDIEETIDTVIFDTHTAPLTQPVQHIETTIKPAVQIKRVADQDESDAGIEMGPTKTNALPPMWQGQTVGVKSVQENPDDGSPAVRFAIGDKIVTKPVGKK